MNYLPWILSCTTVFNMWLAGNKNYWAWIIGLISQSLWFIYAFDRAVGLLPGVTALTFVYARNLWLWRKETVRA